jgi:hypothetical protein
MGALSSFDDIAGWSILQKNSAALETSYAATTTQVSDIAYFQSIASTLTSPEALLNNYRALQFVTTAYGLQAQSGQTAILNKLMTQDPTSKSSLAQQLADSHYLKFAQALSTWAPPPFSSQDTIDSVIAAYKENSFETSVGQDNSALQEAQYFSQNAQGKTTLAEVMADPALLDVVRVSLGIPESFGSLDYSQQVQILSSRVDLKQFSSASGVQSMITKYLAMDEINKVNSGDTVDPMVSLFQPTSITNADGSVSTKPGLALTASIIDFKA